MKIIYYLCIFLSLLILLVPPKTLANDAPVTSATPALLPGNTAYNRPWIESVSQRQNYGFDPCSCVSYAKAFTGFSQEIGYAKNWPINSTTPEVGGVIILNEGLAGHVAVISGIENGFIYLKESNFSHCQLSTRKLETNNPDIKGYWIPNL